MTNTLSLEESKAYYERYAVPGAGPILFEEARWRTSTANGVRVDFKRNERAPMLFVGFGQDHVVPVSVARAIVKKYRQSEAITEYVEFADRRRTSPEYRDGARCRSRPRLGCRPRHDPVAVALTERPSTTWKWAARTVAPRASSEGAGLFVVALLGATAACGAGPDLSSFSRWTQPRWTRPRCSRLSDQAVTPALQHARRGRCCRTSVIQQASDDAGEQGTTSLRCSRSFSPSSRASTWRSATSVPVAPPGTEPDGVYPTYGVPAEMVVGLRTAGFDRCSLASNHTMDKGAAGIDATSLRSTPPASVTPEWRARQPKRHRRPST